MPESHLTPESRAASWEAMLRDVRKRADDAIKAYKYAQRGSNALQRKDPHDA